MLTLHIALSNTLLLLLLICAGWSIVGLITGRGVASALRATLVLTLVASVAELLLGLVLVAQGLPLNPIHVLYGLSIIVSLAGAYMYGSRTTPQREVLVYALLTVFAVGLIFRAMETARPPV
jgi:hypothetical protein